MLKTKIGANAEEQAAKFLISNNLKIIQSNYKALPYGEIDIIALQNNTLVFIEVKYRSTTTFAKAEEMITYSKQNKLINAANIFLQRYPRYENYECRFDVIAINNNDINWIKDAFSAY